jgi:integrase-like protein/calcineurin-like phosphoesterase family protein
MRTAILTDVHANIEALAACIAAAERERVDRFVCLGDTVGYGANPNEALRPMRFHDLRHSVATLLLRERVDAHRVQRLLRHRDVKTTTGTYGHLVVEDLLEAINLLPPSRFAASLLQDSRSMPRGVQNSTIGSEENPVSGLERETGIEPATLSLGS